MYSAEELTQYPPIIDRATENLEECEFLVGGFDAKARAHLFTVTEPGTDSIYDEPGFCAIGTGKYAAEGMLYFLGQRKDCDIYATIFNLCAAKFMDEKVLGVGSETFLFAKKPGTNVFPIEAWVIPTIGKAWEDQGKPRIPQAILDTIRKAQFDFLAAPF